MFLTKLHRQPDHKPNITSDLPDDLPKTVLALVWRLLKLDRNAYLFINLCSAVNTALFILVPYGLKLVIDAMATAESTSAPDMMAAVMPGFTFLLILIFARMITGWVTWFTSYHTGHIITQRIKMIGASYVLRHEPAFFESELSGRIIQKLSDLTSQVDSLRQLWLWDIFPTIIYFAVATALLASSNLQIALFTVLWLCTYAALSIYVSRDIKKYAARHAEVKSRGSGLLADIILNIRNVFFFTSQQREMNELANRYSDAINSGRLSYLATLNTRLVNQLMGVIAYLFIIGGGLYAWSIGKITAGDFAMMVTIIILVLQRTAELADKLPEIYESWGYTQDSIKTLIRPHALQDAPNAEELTSAKQDISLNNVLFKYDENNVPVFNSLNLTIKAGQRVGLVGASRAGKSTLVNLLLRLHDTNDGAIKIGTQNIRFISQQSLREAISYIPQDTILFHRHIADNIAYGKPDATMDEIIEAARKANIHDFIASLPNGYETYVGERGIKLSGGQRQRVAIARALLKNAPILILDEATSALDSESEAHIQTAIRSVMEGKTVITIAHRLSTIAHLDRLIVLDKGEIVEDGTHAELLEKNGIYAKLWQRQSGGFIGA